MKAIIRFFCNTWRVIVTVFALVAILLPFVMMGALFLTIPSQHNRTFHGGLDGKVERLESIEGSKLVVIGGSSVAFGLDSALLERYVGMPVVNFGLYAELGTKIMLDMSEDSIRSGDVIVIAPELDPQTLSMYFNGGATWKAIDDDPALFLRIKTENWDSMWGSLWKFGADKLGYFLSGKKPELSSVYHSKYFNEAGDIVYTLEDGSDGRPQNTMAGYYDTMTPIDPSIDIFDSEFMDYLNDYVKRMKAKGATVYFGFCPSNSMAVVDAEGNCLGVQGQDDKSNLPIAKISQFMLDLSVSLGCPVLGNFSDYVYLPNYFYDSNFHLNSAGVELHTLNLADDLYSALYGIKHPTIDSYSLREMPELPGIELAPGMDEAVVYGDFLLKLDESTGTFKVVGVSEAGLAKETLIVPSEATVTYLVGQERTDVTADVSIIDERAFSACTATRTVVIADTARMIRLESYAFAGSSVTELYLFCSVNGFSAGFFQTDTAPGFVTYVRGDSDYWIDYFWETVDKQETNKTFADFAGN